MDKTDEVWEMDKEKKIQRLYTIYLTLWCRSDVAIGLSRAPET